MRVEWKKGQGRSKKFRKLKTFFGETHAIHQYQLGKVNEKTVEIERFRFDHLSTWYTTNRNLLCYTFILHILQSRYIGTIAVGHTKANIGYPFGYSSRNAEYLS